MYISHLAVLLLFKISLNTNQSMRDLTNLLLLHARYDCTARQCSPLRRKLLSAAQSLLMKHLVIGQR